MVGKTALTRHVGDDGFTLIELFVIVIVIGILVAIAIPLYLGYTTGAKNRSAQSDLRGSVGPMELCKSDHGSYGTPGTYTITESSPLPVCVDETLHVSTGTTMTLVVRAGGDSWTASATNSGGNKTYSYDSLVGGSVN